MPAGDNHNEPMLVSGFSLESPGGQDPSRSNSDPGDTWLSLPKFLTILSSLLALQFWRVLAGLECFFYRDFALFSYPLAAYHKECFWRGELPLWNPLNCCGLPHLAQWNTHVLYPLSAIYLFFPLPWSFATFCLAHLVIGGTGMYLLARRWTSSGLAAGSAGLIFAFNGFSWSELVQGADIAALGWMPWVVLLAEISWVKGGRWCFVTSAVGAVQMLAGAPEIILFTWVYASALWVVACWRTTPQRWPLLLARVTGTLALTAGLAAAQLAPFIDFLAHSGRSSGAAGSSAWPMPLSGFANYLVPLFHTMRDSHGVFSFYDQQWISSYYLGIGTIALALLAVRKLGDARTLAIFTLASAGCLLGVGEQLPFFPFLQWVIPLINFMRFPIKFVILPTFGIPLLASISIARYLKPTPDRSPFKVKELAVVGGSVLSVVALVAWWASRFPRTMDDLPLTVSNGLSRSSFLIAILFLLPLVRASAGFSSQRYLQMGFLILLWLDVMTHAPSLSPTVHSSAYGRDLVRKELGWDDRFRFEPLRTLKESASGSVLPAFGSHLSFFMSERRSLCADLNLLDNLPSVTGLSSLNLRESARVDAELKLQPSSCGALRDFLAISHGDFSAETGWRERTGAMPIVTVGQEPRFLNDESTLNAITSSAFQPRQVVYLPADARDRVSEAGCANAHITNLIRSPHHISFEVSTPAATMATVAQTYYHPWKAFIDGEPVPIWRANYAFQAVRVPGGNHLVELVYRDYTFAIGAVLTLVCIAVVAFGLLQEGKGASNAEPQKSHRDTPKTCSAGSRLRHFYCKIGADLGRRDELRWPGTPRRTAAPGHQVAARQPLLAEIPMEDLVTKRLSTKRPC